MPNLTRGNMTRRIKKVLEERPCSVCGRTFMPVKINNNKCSAACRAKWYRMCDQKRSEERKERSAKKFKKRKCMVCGNKYMGPKHRQTCSSVCAKRYVDEGLGMKVFKRRKGKKRTVPQMAVSSKNIAQSLTVLAGDIRYKERLEIAEAMARYRDNGGKIQVLSPEPDQKIPSVNLIWKGFSEPHDADAWDLKLTSEIGTFMDSYLEINTNIGE